MSFLKLIERLAWLALVAGAMATVGLLGLVALILGLSRVQVVLIVDGALIFLMFVLWMSARRQRRQRRRQRPQPVATYAAQFTAPAAWPIPVAAPPIQSSHLVWQPLEPPTPKTGHDTRPIRPVKIEEPPPDPIEDTKQPPVGKPAPVYTISRPGHGPYDDLFPPPEPGDEDYLEYDRDTTAKVPIRPEPPESPGPITPLAPDEQPTTPVSVNPARIEQPGARSDETDRSDRSDEADQADLPGESGEPAHPAHPDRADGDAQIPPDNSLA